MTSFEKFNVLNGLNRGDVVLLTNGEIAQFGRLKQKKFIGTMNGTSYDIPVTMFQEVLERVETPDLSAEYKSLKYNEPFFIEKNGNALLFFFQRIEGGRIIGKNPISGGNVRIDVGLYAGKVNK
jgi:hypothetical protein